MVPVTVGLVTVILVLVGNTMLKVSAPVTVSTRVMLNRTVNALFTTIEAVTTEGPPVTTMVFATSPDIVELQVSIR